MQDRDECRDAVRRGATITVNGKRATLSGFANDFATVTESPDGRSEEWSWQAALRIVNAGGNFRW